MSRNEDKRRSFRATVAGPPQHAVLKIGERELPVTLLNESAHGLGVLTDDPGKLWVDQTGMLKTTTTWLNVRVKYVLRNEPKGQNGTSAAGKFRIGLERLGEIAQLNEKTGSRFSHVVDFLFPRESSAALTGLSVTVLVLTLVLLSLVVVTFTWSHFGPLMTNWLH
jgi:hypothetical protein